MEGSSCFRDGGDACLTDALTLPVTEYGHDEGCSVTGGAVYRGEAPAGPARLVRLRRLLQRAGSG